MQNDEDFNQPAVKKRIADTFRMTVTSDKIQPFTKI
jgi:hypothetical protein